MIYVTIYLAFGFLILVGMLVHHLLVRRRESDFLREMMPTIYPERVTLRYRLIHGLFLPIATALVVLVAWPIALTFLVKALLVRHVEVVSPVKEKFRVRRNELLREMNIEEIEVTERVFDPLGAAPNLPFGHLHALWTKFKAGLKPNDTLWAFSAQWPRGKDRGRRVTGYVAVREGMIGQHFLCTPIE